MSLAQAEALPSAQAQTQAQAAAKPRPVPRDLPILSVPSGGTQKPQAEPKQPKQPKADFGPLAAGEHARFDARRAAQEADPAPQTSLVSPVDGAVVATETPVLQVAAVGDGVLYCFKISTGFDGRSGSVVDSGCLDQPQWTVPKHVLHDGGRYTWTAATAMSGATTATAPQWVGHFTVNQRVGDPGPAPTDHLGPVTVNLFNGNAHVEAAGPAFQTVGGSAGVSLAYNSREGTPRGVRASYFNDSRHEGKPDATPVMVRGESQVNLDWGIAWSGNPDNRPWRDNPMPPALDKNWFVVRWEGQFKASVTGDFRFAGAHTDGARIWVGDKLVYDNPNPADPGDDFLLPGPQQSSEVALNAGQLVPLRVELYHHSDQRPRMVLWAKSSSGADDQRSHNLDPRIVPTEWLMSADSQSLPAGWTLSVQSSGYSRAEMLDGSVVLTDAAGGKHTWTKASTGGYRPPVGEDGVLAFDTAGRITVTEGDTVSLFNPDGTLAAVESVLDAKKPAALQYLYSGTRPRLTQIKDPVSGRSHRLFYNTDGSNSCYGGVPRPPGSDQAPQQMLCRIRYWDGSETRLWYQMGTLARIENPGAVMQDFDYLGRASARERYDQAGDNEEEKQKALDSIGPLTTLRGGLAYDWVARQAPSAENGCTNTGDVAAACTVIGYDSVVEQPQEPPALRAVQVMAPAPDGRSSELRAEHFYQYYLERKQATVALAGVYDSTRSRTVTYDDAGRTLVTTDLTGASIAAEWNAKDQATAAVDSAGRRSTTVYDHADRPVDKYGPAPASCFNGQTPTAACAAKMPHSHTNYDEGLAGLSAAFYENPELAGVPKAFTTGVGSSDGALSRSWGASPPVANTGGWSGRFIGEMKLPATGDYGLGFTAVDGVRLWVDDVLTVDSWSDKPSTAVTGKYTNTTADSWHRIRVDYYNRSGTTGALDFTWTPPGTQAPAPVPGTHLAPRYGWATSSTTEDTSGGDKERAPSRRSASSYSDPAAGIDPAYGLAVATTADPDGLGLTARTRYEQPGDGYLRKVTSAMPAGDIAAPDRRTTTTYYGDSETRTNPCDPKAPAANQGGMAKTSTEAKPADGPALTGETVYDEAGRVVAQRVNGEAWICTSYDARGRVVKKTAPAYGAEKARTVITDYAVGGDPLISKVSDENGSITTRYDLLGQEVGYTDANGVTSTATYDQVGRLIKDTTVVKGVSSTVAYAWNDANQLTNVKVDGTTVAAPAYDATTELTGVVYGNGSRLDSLARNESGKPTALTWKTAESTVVDAVTRSRDNRITDDVVTEDGKTAANYSYTYDTVGRLVAATVPHHQLTYRFDPTDGCGTARTAGLNTNRTASTDSFNGAAAVTTNYCYDGADRLTSTSGGTALSFAYDSHGDTVKVGGDTLGYDSTKRHMRTTTASGTAIVYTRDPDDRLTARTVTGATDASKNGTTRYSYSSTHDDADLILDKDGGLLQRIVALPGGVLLTKNYDASATTNWSYPNIHGDVLFTADGTAARTGGLRLYDPFGQNIDPATGAFSDIPIPATAAGGMDFGWLGQHERPVEHLAGQQAIEMGARVYLPVLGRFLQVDPVAGGSANNYDYVNADPVNGLDLAGTFSWKKVASVATTAAEVVSFVPGPVGTVASGVAVAGQLAQGNKQAAAAAALGMIPGGKLASTLAKSAAKEASTVGKAAAAAEKCNSFTPDTQVVMADGTAKPISEVQEGDQVQATDPATGATAGEPVAGVITGHGTKHLIDIGLAAPHAVTITATAGHPIYVQDRGWVNAGDIRTGDLLRNSSGVVRVTSVHDRGEVADQTVYNLSISRIHTYHVQAGADRVLVHNTGCPVHAPDVYGYGSTQRCTCPGNTSSDMAGHNAAELKSNVEDTRARAEAGGQATARAIHSPAASQDPAGVLPVALGVMAVAAKGKQIWRKFRGN
ncbi:PA14 domain-containing protein [Streptomyces sp. TBY4]|uniref:PA14 domain-containing protein n=1 Tax=Streptomyces sp. TBY4 TaxID=2962030 RepID=UPI0020B74BD6|nr:PA14 domain-containing protein [Streptomyces sp. TBY4]MCP3759357.1 PA14 domain-containing protein [Streptomyces sp. TBY4]